MAPVLIVDDSRTMGDATTPATSLLAVDGSVITAAGCGQRDDDLEAHYARLRVALARQLVDFAEECQDEAIVDLRQVPLRPEHAVDMIVVLDRTARGLGLRFSLVGTPDYASLLRRVATTVDIPVHDTLDRARGLAA
jgi:hypothetical protein